MSVAEKKGDPVANQYQNLADAIIANTQHSPDPFTYHPQFDQSLATVYARAVALRVQTSTTGEFAAIEPLVSEHSPPVQDPVFHDPLAQPVEWDEFAGRVLKVGPFEVRPGLNQEVPIGRGYQRVSVNSISRLAAFLGRDDFGLYIREVPDDPENGLKPSRNGVWVKQPNEEEFQRLAPGQSSRISKDTDVRIGGNGNGGSSGFRLYVV